MQDMSTKPDDSVLFAAELNPALPSAVVDHADIDRANNHAAAELAVESTSTDMSEAVTTSEDSTLSVPKTRNASTTMNGTMTASEETTVTSSSEKAVAGHNITLYFLQSSRAIRIAWLLEELALPYKVVFFDREPDLSAPPSFITASDGKMGKSPVLLDGSLVLEESGAITQYLCEKYDDLHYVLPSRDGEKLFKQRMEVEMFMHAAEVSPNCRITKLSNG